MSKYKNIFDYFSIMIFMITIFLLIVIIFLSPPDFNLKKLENIIATIISILVATGITTFIKKKIQTSKIFIPIICLLVSIIIWISFFPIHCIQFNLEPNDTDVFLNNNKKENSIKGIRAGNYNFIFEKDGYRNTTIKLSYIDVIFKKSFDIKLKPLKGSLYIKSNIKNPIISMKKDKIGLKKKFGSINRLDSIDYGDYWIILNKKGYYSDSVFVKVNSDTKHVKINLSKIPLKKYLVHLITNSNSKVYLKINNQLKLLSISNDYGIAKFYLLKGPHTLKIIKNNDYIQQPITIKENIINNFNIPF